MILSICYDIVTRVLATGYPLCCEAASNNPLTVVTVYPLFFNSGNKSSASVPSTPSYRGKLRYCPASPY